MSARLGLPLLLALGVLAGCGGGGSDGEDTAPVTEQPGGQNPGGQNPGGQNRQPTANAGSDRAVQVGAQVVLDGSGSTDPDGDALAYSWTLVTRPAGSSAALSGANTVQPTFTADVAGRYDVRLIVNDGKVDSAPDTVSITAQAGSGSPGGNRAPTANAGPDRSVTVGTLVTLDGAMSSDPDGDQLTYRWTLESRPAGSQATLSGTTAAQVTFTADVAGQYVARLVVNDGTVDSAPDTITITAGSNAPPVGSVITEVRVSNTSASAAGNLPITFGHAFVAGDVPSGATIKARTAGQNPVNVPLQVDVKTRHPDGSVRFAVLSARVPQLDPSGSRTVELVSSQPGNAEPAVSAADLLATSFDAVVSLNVGGTVYSASARELLAADSSRTWLEGPLVTEWMVSSPVKTSAGQAHQHLTARFNIRAYAGLDRVRVDVVVENNWAHVPGAANRTYDVTITVGGQQVYSRSNFTHYHHARWRKTFWWGGAAPPVHLAHDTAYLIRTGAVPSYDQTIVISESALRDEERTWNSSETDIGDVGVVDPYMPGVGGRPDIGPLPRWSARYVLSMDPRARRTVVGQGDLAGSWPIHLRDHQTDLPVSIVDYPDIYWDNLPGATASAGGFEPDRAHQPSLAFLPYLITGDHYYMEEMQFWTTWNWVIATPNERGRDNGHMATNQEVRAHAWVLRTLAHTAWSTPDDHPMKSYFESRLANALAWYDKHFTDNPNANKLGWMSSYAVRGDYDPVQSSWMDDFLTQTVGWIKDLGYTQVTRFVYYKSRLSVGLMTDPGYCYILATSYRKQFGSGGRYFESFAEIYEPTLRNAENGYSNVVGLPCGSQQMASALRIAQGEMVQDYWPYSYASVMYGALAAAVDVGFPRALEAYDKLANRVNPVGASEGYEFDPTFAIVPRTVNRKVLP